MQSDGNSYGFHAEEADLDGNLMAWLLEEDRNAVPVPSQSALAYNFGPASHNGQYFYEGFGTPSVYLPTINPSTPTYVNSTTQDEVFGSVDGYNPSYPEEPMRGGMVDLGQQQWEIPEVKEVMSARRSRPQPVITVAQAKNRKAQKKFREKQKAKMSSLSEEVELLRKRVQSLSVENKDLENSNMLLNKVVKMRDREMNTLKFRNECLTHHQEKSKQGQKLLTCSGGSGDSEILSMERSENVEQHLMEKFPASKFSPVSNEGMKQIWKKYVDELSDLLIENDLHPNDPSIMDRIHLAVGELGEICMKYATLCPSAMCSLVANSELSPSMHPESEEAQSFWRNVLLSLNLTPQQEQETLSLRSRFLQHLDSVWKTRNRLSNRLQSVVVDKNGVFSSNSVSCRLGKALRETVEDLKDTVFTDGQYHTDFIASFFQIVLKDIQTARVFVQSYPYYPDVLLLANLVYLKHRDESQDDPPKSDSHSPVPVSLMSSSN